MRLRVRIILCAGLFSSAVCAESPRLPFKPPFDVKNAVIVDQDGRKVKLWGVNYRAPFNHKQRLVRAMTGYELTDSECGVQSL